MRARDLRKTKEAQPTRAQLLQENQLLQTRLAELQDARGGPAAADLDSRARGLLLKKRLRLVDLANALGCPPQEAEAAVRRLKGSGYNLDVEADLLGIRRTIAPGNVLVVDSANFFDGTQFTLGLIGDTHLYSKYARLDCLNALYDIFSREGIKNVFHTGNIIDGEKRGINDFDLLGLPGFEAQADYLADFYPRRDGIVTQFITGDDHEGWYVQREGLNVGMRLEQTARARGRSDLVYIGHMEADIHFQAPKGRAWMRVMHPGGGSAYAISYTEQKIVESFQGGEKPQILVLGHYHKFNHGYPREVQTVQTGCVQDQTPFMRKNKLQAMVGGCIARFHQADTGEINRFQVEWIPFYDRGFYEKHEKYRRW